MSEASPTGDMVELDSDVRVELYRFFANEARAPVPFEIAESLGVRTVDVEAALKRMHDSHVLVLAPGTPYVWMANPFSALPTPYTVACGGKTFWGNCIWDALGIVAALGVDGDVTAGCADCGERLSLQIRGGRLADTDPDHLVHYAVPAARWWDDIGFN